MWRFIPLLIVDMASQEREIFTSLSAARSLLEQEGHRPLLLVEESALEDFTGGFCCSLLGSLLCVNQL